MRLPYSLDGTIKGPQRPQKHEALCTYYTSPHTVFNRCCEFLNIQSWDIWKTNHLCEQWMKKKERRRAGQRDTEENEGIVIWNVSLAFLSHLHIGILSLARGYTLEVVYLPRGISLLVSWEGIRCTCKGRVQRPLFAGRLSSLTAE